MALSQSQYLNSVHAVRSRVLAGLNLLWFSSPSYRDAAVDGLVSRFVPLVQAGQLQVASLTAAYLGEQVGVKPVVDRVAVVAGRGVAAGEVYRRPAVTVYTGLSEGKSLTVAVNEGARRLASLASTDLQLAKTSQARSTLSDGGVTSYRRVLTGAENCALCVVASMQRYRIGDLMPIHPGCDCAVDVLPRGWDPDRQVIDPDLLDNTYTEIATRLSHRSVGLDARDLGLQKVDARGRPISDFTDLIVTREHGEYGPTLTWRDEKFTSAADIAALA